MKKQDIDLRINTLPTIHGETVVIRLLDKSEALFDPAGIGLEGDNLEKYQRLIGSNNGMVLIVGPTGSGKSSTCLLYTSRAGRAHRGEGRRPGRWQGRRGSRRT